jgi:SAM-dependent methyltransferase
MTDLWDTLAPNYDAWYATPLGAFVLEAEIAALMALIGEVTNVRGLEIGCGTGQFGRAFAQRGARMVGVDRSAAMLRAAVRHPTETLSLCRAEGEHLPFRIESFDLVALITVLEFVRDPRALLAEAWRVLRPGGRLAIGVLNAWSPWAVARRLRQDESPYAQAHFFQPPELLRLLSAIAGGPVRWRGAVFLPPWTKGRARAWWSRVEITGARLAPMFGAFLVAVTRLPAGAP